MFDMLSMWFDRLLIASFPGLRTALVAYSMQSVEIQANKPIQSQASDRDCSTCTCMSFTTLRTPAIVELRKVCECHSSSVYLITGYVAHCFDCCTRLYDMIVLLVHANY